jgi:endonuclease/exonuclease/phosphatase family metal-dependent hydrolase
VGLAAFVALLAGAGRPLASLPPWAIGLWNAAFVVCLASGLRLFQIDFPAQPGAYPLAQPDWPAWRALPLLLSVLLSPVILLDFGLYGREILRLRPTMRQLGAGFGLGALFLLLLTLAHVFTTVYDYIPVVGPLFRDRFWLVYLVAGLGAALPLLAVDWRCYPSEARAGQAQPRGWGGAGAAAWLAGGFLSLALLAAAFWELRPVVAVESGNQLRVLTFNIQQGYNANGRKNYLGQLGVLYRARPEVIGLEESDTNRLSGSNDDLVRFLANQLGMHEYYSPNTTVGTFGLALLSKYPIEAPRTFYFYSEGEQTAAITARIRKGDRVFNVFVTHLGNGGPLVQQEALLKLVAGQPDVIAMGDFNFDPSEEQYRRMVQVLADAWLLRWPSGSDDRGYNPSDRIDHVFVSPGTQVSEARFLTGPASDHPALLVQVGW